VIGADGQDSRYCFQNEMVDKDEICSKFNKWSSKLKMSKSSRLVDWSDKLKNMEIKDVLDIDIGNISCEMSSQSSIDDDKDNKIEKKSRKKSSNHDDSFTQYLEKLQAEDDNFRDSLDLNYNLDQLGNYQSCYIDNKKATKNRGPVPDDIITHLDYLDEGVLIMQPVNNGGHQQKKPPPILLENSAYSK
jgi:hypothetical protein